MMTQLLRRPLLACSSLFVPLAHAHAPNLLPSSDQFAVEFEKPAQAAANRTFDSWINRARGSDLATQDLLINRARKWNIHSSALEKSMVQKEFMPALAEHLSKKQVWMEYSTHVPLRRFPPPQRSPPLVPIDMQHKTPETRLSPASQGLPFVVPMVPLHPNFWGARDKRRTTQKWSDAADGRRRRASLLTSDNSRLRPALVQESSREVSTAADPDALIKTTLIEHIRKGAGHS